MEDIDKAKLDAILNERNGMRLELLQMIKSQHSSLFAFIAIAAATSGVYWDHRIIADAGARESIMFCLSQVGYLIIIFVLLLSACINVNVGYTMALEKKINSLCDDSVNVWESEITKHYFARPGSAFHATYTVLVIALFLTFAALTCLAYNEFKQQLFVITYYIELLSIIVLVIWIWIESKDICKYAANALSLNIE